MKHLSKWLSYVLRHDPASAGVELDPEGWVFIEDLTATDKITKQQLLEVVATNDKQRFELDADQTAVRARYGHSTDITRQYPLATDAVLYHGTQRRFLDDIQATGLLPMSRQYVHLTNARDMAVVVGKRRGSEVVMLQIDAAAMRRAGLALYDAGRAVVLTASVPAQYLTVVP